MEHTHDTTHDSDDDSILMMRRTVIQLTAAGVGLAAAGGRVAAQDTGEQDVDAEVVLPEQTTNGLEIEVESASLPDGGFVSVRDPTAATRNAADQFETDWFELTVLGASEYLEPGTHEDFEIELDRPMEASTNYMVVLHQETTGDETFEFVGTQGEEDRGYPQPGSTGQPGNLAVGDGFVTVEVSSTDLWETINQIGDLEDQLEALENENADREGQIADLEGQIADLEGQIADSDDDDDDSDDDADDDDGDDGIPGFGPVTALAGAGAGAALAAKRLRGRGDDGSDDEV